MGRPGQKLTTWFPTIFFDFSDLEFFLGYS